MTLWLIMVLSGLLTFLTRLSFIILLEKIKLPAPLQRALRLAPIAVLSAIIAPQLAYHNDVFLFSPSNPRLMAGLFATGVAYVTKNVVWTIVGGMLVFWLLERI
ncbi:MAG: branched-chain amino acid ABC transporter permease [Anaerolineae bacterium CG_4_9_14_3_um_filter_57_17]|nr:AzlD domain-containing protein [bacterium]NCT21226.1 AzlD domain-containing protein [bacterium]OIO84254.1 MAG: hypothetical protein AUK01_10150 [Anaerolineae bacterium CG2_30_57_67]PJB68602.1 MAG: branched-chain amino acid ABC transporter permease [Anaerolineae bacterium CG_4_9_14_3_um_filter_57_17]